METPGFGVLDYLIIVLYLAGMVAAGYWIGRRQANTEDYFLAGRKMSWWPVAISLFASLFSAISYIAMPGEAYNYGMNFHIGNFVMLATMPVVILVFLRLFYNLRLFTAYGYLAERFGSPVRTLGSLIFLVLRGLYLGVVLYATALLLQPAMGWPLYVSILVVGVISTLYTVMGGMKAVIWTDVVQFVILMFGIVAIIVLVAMQMDGGVIGIWKKALEMGHGYNIGRGSGFWDFSFKQRLTIWVYLFSFFPACVSHASDQVNLQRCMTCKDFRTAGWAMFGNGFGSLIVCFLLYYCGLCILIYFKVLHPSETTANLEGDHAFTMMITHIMPNGVRGLMMAAILAAVMSTVDSVVNSLAAVSIKDFYEPFIRPGRSETHYLKASRALTWFWGLSSVVFALIIVFIYHARKIPLIEVSNVTLSFFGTLILGLFILGLMNPRANIQGAFIGFACALPLTAFVLIRFYLMPERGDQISFVWIGAAGWTSLLVIGSIASLFFPRPAPERVFRHVVLGRFFSGGRGRPTAETSLK